MNDKVSKEKLILCPDCKEIDITHDEYVLRGKCKHCLKRETNLLARDMEYVKFVDLPEAEKIRIRARRLKQNEDYERRYIAKKAKKTQVDLELNRTKRRYGVFTDEIVSYLIGVASPDITLKELKILLFERFPDMKSVADATIYAALRKYGIPYKKLARYNMKQDNIADEYMKDINTNVVETISDNIDVESNNESPINVSNNVIDMENTVAVKHDSVQVSERLDPIRQEVKAVLEPRFSQSNCAISHSYSVEDYLMMLNMLLDLCSNLESNIESRKAQETIFNDYQNDIVHEMENVLLEPGDTYFQDKMNVMREYRRLAKMDIDALEILKPVINVVRTLLPKLTNKGTLDYCKEKLEALLSTSNQKLYIPRVDRFMIAKYDWALDKEPPKKRTSYNTTRSVNTRGRAFIGDSQPTGATDIQLTNDMITAGVGVYRVSCRISGGGYGAFRHWHKDYACTSDELAITFAQQELARMKASNKGLLITDLSCHKLNVGGS